VLFLAGNLVEYDCFYRGIYRSSARGGARLREVVGSFIRDYFNWNREGYQRGPWNELNAWAAYELT
jgi:hypothetical protein